MTERERRPPITFGWILILSASAAFIVLVVAITFSFRPVRQDDLIRSFTCTYPYGNETLTIKPDGTYHQVISFNDDSQPETNDGTWDYHSEELALHGAIIIDNAFGERRVPEHHGLWNLRTGHSISGRVYISVNEDVELYFQ